MKRYRHGQDSRESLVDRILMTIMLVFLSVYPTVFAIRHIVEEVGAFSYAEGRWFILLLTGLVYVVIIGMFSTFPQHIERKKRLGVLGVLYAAAMLPRMFVSFTMQSTPGSDFADSVNYAMMLSGVDLEFLATVPYHGAYAIVLKVFMRLLNSYSLVTGQLMNCLITSAIPLVIFQCVDRLTGNARASIGAALFYTFCPSMITYTTIMSPEHISQFLIVLMFLVYIDYSREPFGSIRRYAYAAAFTVLFGCMCLFKELYVLFAPVVAMSAICFELIPAVRDRTRSGRRKWLRIGEILLVNLMILIFAFAIYQGLVYATQVILLGDALALETPMSVPFMHNVYRGLSIIARGSWSAEVNEIANGTYEEYAGTSQLSGAYLKRLCEEYNGSVSELWATIDEKIYVDWCKEGTIYWWASRGDRAIYAGTEAGNVMFRYGPMVYLLFFYILLIPMLLSMLWKIWKCNCGTQSMFYLIGVFFLFVLMLTLMECQSRYKSNIMPLLSCIFGIGIMDVTGIIKTGTEKILATVRKRSAPEK